MFNIVTPPSDFFKKKKYACPKCGKTYKWERLQYNVHNGKCPKCNKDLINLDMKKHTM